jgi:mannosyltransferase
VAAAATVAAAVLVAWGIGTRSFWLDEAFSVEVAGGTWAHLWARVSTREANMSLYYVLLHGWLALGRDEATVRALSAIAVVAAVPLTHRVGLALVGPWAAAAGAVLLATHPFVVRYGQEARAYSLAMLLVVGASLALVRTRWIVWVVTCVLAAYAHLLTLVVVAAEVLVGRRRVPPAALAVVALLVTPMLWFVTARDAGQIDWLGPPDAGQLAWVAWKLGGDAGWVGVGAYAVAMLVAVQGGGAGVRFLVAWAVLPFVVLVAVSFVKPLFLDRYLLPTVPGIVLLAAAGLARWPAPWRTIAVLALVALQAVGLARVARQPSTEDWRGVAAAVRADGRAGDAVACWVDFACVALDYEFARPPAGAPPIVWLVPPLDDSAALAAIVDAHPRLWLALSHVQVGQSDRTATLARIEAMLAPHYTLADTRDFAGVVLRRYDRPTASD